MLKHASSPQLAHRSCQAAAAAGAGSDAVINEPNKPLAEWPRRGCLRCAVCSRFTATTDRNPIWHGSVEEFTPRSSYEGTSCSLTGEDCRSSSDCNISKGLCCKLQRRARSQPKKVSDVRFSSPDHNWPIGQTIKEKAMKAVNHLSRLCMSMCGISLRNFSKGRAVSNAMAGRE